jgi:hypothetical protein
MEFYSKMIENLDELQVREDGEYEPFIQYDIRPTYGPGVFFDEVYGEPLRNPRKPPYFLPDSGCNKVFQSPYSNIVLPHIKQGENVNYGMYDSPGPGIARYASFPTSKYNNDEKVANPFTKYPSLPTILKKAGSSSSTSPLNSNYLYSTYKCPTPSYSKQSDFITNVYNNF